jgi:hypothetical protein
LMSTSKHFKYTTTAGKRRKYIGKPAKIGVNGKGNPNFKYDSANENIKHMTVAGTACSNDRHEFA